MCTAPDDRDIEICCGCQREVSEEDFREKEMDYCMVCLEVICPDCMDELGLDNFTCPGCGSDYRYEQPSLEEQANG